MRHLILGSAESGSDATGSARGRSHTRTPEGSHSDETFKFGFPPNRAAVQQAPPEGCGAPRQIWGGEVGDCLLLSGWTFVYKHVCFRFDFCLQTLVLEVLLALVLCV